MKSTGESTVSWLVVGSHGLWWAPEGSSRGNKGDHLETVISLNRHKKQSTPGVLMINHALQGNVSEL